MITNPEKIYFEKEKITKGDVLNYYASIAPYILPHLKNRPESLKRFPEGIAHPSFFQKNLKSHPDWLTTIAISHRDKTINYALIQDVKSLLYVVNLGCIEIHPWLSQTKNLDKPDFLLFDLDPQEVPFDAVVETALCIHATLEEWGVSNYCKTSGSRGLHICVPLKAHYSYEQSKNFALLIAHLVHQKLPKITSLERLPKNRKKRVYIDCFQNNYGQTIIAPYSLRAKPGAPVSTPLEWKEVKNGLNPLSYNIYNIFSRLEKKGDLFAPVIKEKTNLKESRLKK